MEQIAMVKSILDNGMAQVAVQRETACGAAHIDLVWIVGERIFKAADMFRQLF